MKLVFFVCFLFLFCFVFAVCVEGYGSTLREMHAYILYIFSAAHGTEDCQLLSHEVGQLFSHREAVCSLIERRSSTLSREVGHLFSPGEVIRSLSSFALSQRGDLLHRE